MVSIRCSEELGLAEALFVQTLAFLEMLGLPYNLDDSSAASPVHASAASGMLCLSTLSYLAS